MLGLNGFILFTLSLFYFNLFLSLEGFTNTPLAANTRYAFFQRTFFSTNNDTDNQSDEWMPIVRTQAKVVEADEDLNGKCFEENIYFFC